ncbi:MAG: dienelactone hydrolase family protein [Gemmatimonadaceae bacterium]
MRTILGVTAVAAAIGVGFATGCAKPAKAVDEHANHDMGAMGPSSRQTAGIPASGATAAERIAKSPRHSEWVAIKVGEKDSVMAWVVYPERKDKAPVVVAIHENTGINTWTRNVADQLAADGFIGIAPDLTTMFRTGDLITVDPTRDAGGAAIRQVTPALANAMIDAVAKYGMSLPAALPKYGIVGFCWGGARSFHHAVHSPSLGASVVYYGSPPTAAEIAAIKAPVLGLYGGNDARINASIPATDSTMKALGKSYEYHIFDGAGHGFLRGRDDTTAVARANVIASQQAWPKTIEFFRAKLGK